MNDGTVPIKFGTVTATPRLVLDRGVMRLTKPPLHAIAPHIVAAVASVTGIAPGEIFTRRRGIAPIAWARQVCMALCYEMSSAGMVSIGQYFCGRDHGTVFHAKRTVQDRISTEAVFRVQVENIKKHLHERLSLDNLPLQRQLPL